MQCKKMKFWIHLELVHCTLKLKLNTDVGCTVNTGYLLGICNVKYRRRIPFLNQANNQSHLHS